MNKLTLLANKYETDKGTKTHTASHHGPRLGFTEVYERYFREYEDRPIVFLEIGIGSGPSVKMWPEYFSQAEIYCIDINPHTNYGHDRVRTLICDQSDRNSLKSVVESIGKPIDIIIDDGSHVCEHQQISLGFLFKYLRGGGQYWVEDLHTSDLSVWKPGTTLYGYDMGGNTGNKNTVRVFENYINEKIFNSDFLSEEENEYLTKNIDNATIFDLERTYYGFNKLSLFAKKREGDPRRRVG